MLYNIKNFSFVKNSGGRESLNSKTEEKEECIIDLTNGFYELPKFIPESKIKIVPKILRLGLGEFPEELDRINYIRAIMTVGLIYHKKFKNFYNIFENESIPDIFFEVSELNISDNLNPFIKVLVSSIENEHVEIKLFLKYNKKENENFSINVLTELNYKESKKILWKLNNVLGDDFYFFNFKSIAVEDC